jgi:glycosyltransferase involved in cell wall biosynthesis
MNANKHIIICSISNLVYQQPLQRVAQTLANNGYKVTLVGRKHRNAPVLNNFDFNQKRIFCFFSNGPLQYLEYNFKLFWYLLFKQVQIITAVDLDTALPVFLASKIKGCKRTYDARELFTEMRELVDRPKKRAIWLKLEKWLMPKFKDGIVVGTEIGKIYNERYSLNYKVVRNIPLLIEPQVAALTDERLKNGFLLFQGYVNYARGFDTLIPAMQQINLPLVICGDGNYNEQLQTLIKQHGVENKVICLGLLPPSDLIPFTYNATIGIHLVEPKGLNQQLSLGNKFFDYIHAKLPQISMAFPEYINIVTKHNVALLVNEITVTNIVAAVNTLTDNKNLYQEMKQNCFNASKELNWQVESKQLIDFYSSI